MKKIIDLYPEAPNEWLYRDHDPETRREFHPSVTIPMDDLDLWHECTDLARLDYDAWWDREHPQPEPEPAGLEPEQASHVDTQEQEVEQ